MSNRKPSDIIHFHLLSDHEHMQKHDSDTDALRKKALQEIRI